MHSKVASKSAQRIIIDNKVFKAKTELHQKEIAIAEIADSLGVNEAVNFNQFIKRCWGITLPQFRKKQKLAWCFCQLLN